MEMGNTEFSPETPKGDVRAAGGVTMIALQAGRVDTSLEHRPTASFETSAPGSSIYLLGRGLGLGYPPNPCPEYLLICRVDALKALPIDEFQAKPLGDADQ